MIEIQNLRWSFLIAEWIIAIASTIISAWFLMRSKRGISRLGLQSPYGPFLWAVPAIVILGSLARIPLATSFVSCLSGSFILAFILSQLKRTPQWLFVVGPIPLALMWTGLYMQLDRLPKQGNQRSASSVQRVINDSSMV